jgi:hypothetical protein
MLQIKTEDKINCFEEIIIDNNVLYIIEGETHTFTSTYVPVIVLTGHSNIISI